MNRIHIIAALGLGLLAPSPAFGQTGLFPEEPVAVARIRSWDWAIRSARKLIVKPSIRNLRPLVMLHTTVNGINRTKPLFFILPAVQWPPYAVVPLSDAETFSKGMGEIGLRVHRIGEYGLVYKQGTLPPLDPHSTDPLPAGDLAIRVYGSRIAGGSKPTWWDHPGFKPALASLFKQTPQTIPGDLDRLSRTLIGQVRTLDAVIDWKKTLALTWKLTPHPTTDLAAAVASITTHQTAFDGALPYQVVMHNALRLKAPLPEPVASLLDRSPLDRFGLISPKWRQHIDRVFGLVFDHRPDSGLLMGGEIQAHSPAALEEWLNTELRALRQQGDQRLYGPLMEAARKEREAQRKALEFRPSSLTIQGYTLREARISPDLLSSMVTFPARPNGKPAPPEITRMLFGSGDLLLLVGTKGKKGLILAGSRRRLTAFLEERNAPRQTAPILYSIKVKIGSLAKSLTPLNRKLGIPYPFVAKGSLPEGRGESLPQDLPDCRLSLTLQKRAHSLAGRMAIDLDDILALARSMGW